MVNYLYTLLHQSNYENKVKLTESLVQLQYHYKFSAVAKARLKYLKGIAVNCNVSELHNIASLNLIWGLAAGYV